MRATVARALRAEALSTQPPPRDPSEPQLVQNHYRFTDSDGNLWGDMRVGHYRTLKRVRRDDAVARRKPKERKHRAPRSYTAMLQLPEGIHECPHRLAVGARDPVTGARRAWREGEPLIVIKPLTHIARGVDFDALNAARARYGVTGHTPKHLLDWLAQGGT